MACGHHPEAETSTPRCLADDDGVNDDGVVAVVAAAAAAFVCGRFTFIHN